MKSQKEQQNFIKKTVEKELLSVLSSDKGQVMLATLIEDIWISRLKDKVKRYCEKYARQELAIDIEDLRRFDPIKSKGSNDRKNQFPHEIYGLASQIQSPNRLIEQARKSTISKQSQQTLKQITTSAKKSPKGKPRASEQSKTSLKTKQKSSLFLKKAKSDQYLHILKADPPAITNRDKVSKQSKDLRLTKSKSQKSSSKHFLMSSCEYSDKIAKDSLTAFECLNQQSANKEKVQKVQKHLSKITDSAQDRQKVQRIIQDNGHLSAKEIAHLIKGMQAMEDISKVTKQPEHPKDGSNSRNKKNSPFHFPEGICRSSKHTYGDAKPAERGRGQSEYLPKTSESEMLSYQSLGKGHSSQHSGHNSKKSNKEKGKIFLKMMEIYGQQNRTEMFQFIQQNQHLSEQQILVRWEEGLLLE